ncbi:MAG: hypothetical protein GY869_03225 [Planctomycetes bacterium]|nr:hypothetical protein [Planctomycetota bacterium]
MAKALMLTNKRVVRVKLETTKGTAVAPDTALLAYDVECLPTTEWIQRSGAGKYLGNNIPGMVGDTTGSMTFKVELRSTGSAAFDAGLLILLQAAGWGVGTPTAPNLLSTTEAQKTISIEVNEDGLTKALSGAQCEMKISGEQGKQVFCEFTAHGKWLTTVEEAVGTWAPGSTLPGKLGSGACTFDSLDMGMNSFEIDLGNVLSYRNTNGGLDHSLITNRDVTLTMDPEAATGISHLVYTKMFAGTEMAFSLTVVDAGGTITIAAPKVQYKEIGLGDRDGLQTNEVTGQCNINSSGNDELTLAIA